MSENRKIRVAITHGDTNGVGYELIYKTFDEPDMLELCTPIIYGSPKVAVYHRKALDMDVNFSIVNGLDEVRDGRINMLTAFDDDVKVEFGASTVESGYASTRAISRAMADINANSYEILVAAPAIGGTQLDAIRQSAGNAQDTLTILVGKSLRIGLVTDILPLKDVSQAITKETIVNKTTIFHKSLRRDFRVSAPRIAILALNPDKGNGDEEQGIIAPAIEELAKAGINAFGPYTADSVFGDGLYDSFDGILAMYHDQGFTPFMALTPTGGVKFTAGLPVVATTVCQGPAFGIAGKGIADESSFRNAIYIAIDMFRNRKNYDDPLANPLGKLYHERRDESDKSRFSVVRRSEKGITETHE